MIRLSIRDIDMDTSLQAALTEDDRSFMTSDSSAQSIMEAMMDETERKQYRLKRMRKGRSKKNEPRSILVVRTQEESLDGEKKTIKQKRRQAHKTLADSLDSSTLSISSTASGVTSSVSYSSVSFREYGIIPGNTPAVSRGVPVTLDWEHFNEINFDLDSYEAAMSTRRSQLQMKMPPRMRSQILLDEGHSWQSIQDAIKDSNIARRQRIRTIERLNAEKFDEGMEKIKRVFRKTFRPTQSKNKNLNLSSDLSLDSDEKDDLKISFKPLSLSRRKKKNSVDDLNTSRSGSGIQYNLTETENRAEDGRTDSTRSASGKNSLDSDEISPISFAEEVRSKRPLSRDSNLSFDSFAFQELTESMNLSRNYVHTDSNHFSTRQVTFWDEISCASSSQDENDNCCGNFLSKSTHLVQKLVNPSK